MTPAVPSAGGVFEALADPTRRGMVEMLSRGPLTVTRLAEPFDMSLAAVVQHLRVLEHSGLVRTQKAGRVRTCSLDPAGFQAAEQWISRCRAEWANRLDRLGALLEGPDPVE